MRAIEKLQEVGIRRLGTPKSGFRYRTAGGRRPSRADLARIRALRIPPAWSDVRISPLRSAKLQAVGRDRAGRWQYRYEEEFARRRASAKYRRLRRFADALPRVRAAVERDLRRRDLSREKVLAAMLRILEGCHMRPGSEAYVRENGSYGLTTLRPRHVTVQRDLVTFDYRGKSGQRHVRELRDGRVARLVRQLLRTPGRDVFQFAEDGEIVDVRRRHVNAYIRAVSGGPFTAKDFRTWAGTLICASEVARALERHGAEAHLKRIASEAVKEVARRLGNTPAVARASYVCPAVLAAFARRRGIACSLGPDDVIGLAPRGGLHPAERALAAFLHAEVEGAAKRPVLRVLRGGSRGRGRAMRPTGATAKPLRRAARAPEGE